MGKIFSKVHLVIPLAVLAAAVALAFTNPGGLISDTQLRVFDAYQRLAPRPYEPLPVKYVDIDDESLARLGQWPWPRTVVADMVQRLTEGGAAVIAFDVVFAEPDRTSPPRIAERLDDSKTSASLRKGLAALPDHDDVLAETLQASGNVITGFVLTETTGTVPERKYGMVTQGDDPQPFLRSFDGATISLPVLEAAAAGNGAFNFLPDRDSIVRRVPLLLRLGDDIYPALSLETMRVATGGTTYQVKASNASGETAYGGQSGINHVKIGPAQPVVVPTTANGEMWIHFTENAPERRLPAWEIFEESFDTNLIAGHILFVGTGAAGLRDLRATPLSPAAAGVEIHVQAVEQMLLGHFLNRPDWAEGAEILFLIVLGLFLILLMNRLGALLCAGVALLSIGGAVYGSWSLFNGELLLIDPVGPSIAVLLIYLTSSLLNFLRTESEKRQVRSAFGQYLSPVLVEQLAQNPDQLRLGGESKRMTFLFMDIRGFTSISEGFQDDPQGLTDLINQFLTPMTNTILSHGGTVDKYMGDCIMAFWNAPLDDPDHSRRACQAAEAMLVELEALNKRLASYRGEAGLASIRIDVGIGINTGECVVGNMGSDQRFDYSVLGDAVNLASRLEGQSKTYGVPIVLGDETRKSVTDFPLLELDLIAVKGREKPVKVYTIAPASLAQNDTAFQRLMICHNALLDSYRAQDWDKAEGHLSLAHEAAPELDVLYSLYAERIAQFRASPPPSDWTGVFVAVTK